MPKFRIKQFENYIVMYKEFGMSSKDLAIKYNCCVSTIDKYLRCNRIDSVPISLGHKNIPYHENEDDYGKEMVHSYALLSKAEKLIYQNLK